MRLWGRVLVHLRITRRRPSLRASEAEVWKVLNNVQKEWQKLATLQGDLTGYHKPKMTPEQKAGLAKGEDHISRKAQPALQRLKQIGVARWQNGWIPVALRLADETLSDAQLAAIEQELSLYADGLSTEQAVAARHCRVRRALHQNDERHGPVGLSTRRDHHPYSGVDQRKMDRERPL